MNRLVIDPGFQNQGYLIAGVLLDVKKENTDEDGTQKQLVTSVHLKRAGVSHMISETTAIDKFFDAIDDWVKSTFSLNEIHELTHVDIEHGFYNAQSMNSWVGYRLAILETGLYFYFKLRFPWLQVAMVPSSTYKRHFGLATGNHANNKKVVVEFARSWFGSEAHATLWLGKNDLSNHIADCLVMLLWCVGAMKGSTVII